MNTIIFVCLVAAYFIVSIVVAKRAWSRLERLLHTWAQHHVASHDAVQARLSAIQDDVEAVNQNVKAVHTRLSFEHRPKPEVKS